MNCECTQDVFTAQVRLASQAVVVGQHLWLIAGWDPGHKQDGGDILSDLWRLDLNTWQWKQLTHQVCIFEALLSASSGFHGDLSIRGICCRLLPWLLPSFNEPQRRCWR